MKKLSRTKIPLEWFDYQLPQELISQQPIKPRDTARLLVLDKTTGALGHRQFSDLAKILTAGDVLVLNDSKVIPARLVGKKTTGGKIEIFLLQKEGKHWRCLIGGKVKAGEKVYFDRDVVGVILEKSGGEGLVGFNCADKKVLSVGQTPLPPYIKRSSRPDDYQTVYAKTAGSVAAPTAGLHFTKSLLAKLKSKGVKIEYLTLHVGLGTFQPVKTKNILEHQIHSEWARLSPAVARRLNMVKRSGGRIVAVGTTTVRTLEAMADNQGRIKPQSRWVNIFIYPGYNFKFVDAMITNFHLPKSTLIMLVSAFARSAKDKSDFDGLKKIKSAYAEAVKKKYRFYSFGDAMLIK